MKVRLVHRVVWLVAFVLVERAGWAGQAIAPTIDGPAPPATMARDQSGRLTLRFVRLTSPLRLDGQLDEAVYTNVAPISEFVQTEPLEGSPATEKTDMWLLYDDENVYVSVRLWESQPDRMVMNEMRRDSPNLMQNENFSFFFDTFYDRRNGVVFIFNPIGGRTEAQATDGLYNRDWNTIWDVRPGRFDGGWTAEAAVPFKSLRYRPGRDQIWGFNARRIDRWKNEVTHLALVPNTLTLSGVYYGAFAATAVGLEAPSGSKNLELKPYAISHVVTEQSAGRDLSNELSGDIGIDAKYGITQSLTADFTYNTDFAQAEADEQQINLTRFSLFFPEKREFFLENQGLFAFGGAGTAGRGDVPVMFYSRRIGLNRGRQVPIEAGGRVTGRVGRYTLGAVNIQTGDEPVSSSRAANFSIVRLRRDVLRKSHVGVIATQRSVTMAGIGSNSTYGADGTFSFYDNLDINSYWARTRTDGMPGEDDASYRAQLDYSGDRYGLVMERLVVGRDFNPEVGFVRRNDMQLLHGQVRFSHRPRSIRTVRRFSWTADMTHTENGAGQLETREGEAQFITEFQSSDRMNIGIRSTYELLPSPFRIASGVTLPVGGYDFQRVFAGFNLGQQRIVSGIISAEHGAFYDGHKTTVGMSTGRAQLAPQFSVEPTISVNWVDLPAGNFTATLAGSRVVYTITPRMFTSALLQYSSDSHTMSTNVRLRWEYRPGSELFAVYNDERNTIARRFPDLMNRAFILKITRLFRF